MGREDGFQTFKSVLVLIINLSIVVKAISLLGARDPDGHFRFAAEVLPASYYLCLLLSLAFGLVSKRFMNYRQPQSRWGARFFASLLLPAFLLLFTLNSRVFSWEKFVETVF